MLNITSLRRIWHPPVILTSCQNATGIDELKDKIDEHRTFTLLSNQREKRLQERFRREVWSNLEIRFRQSVELVWNQLEETTLPPTGGNSYEFSEMLWKALIGSSNNRI